MICYSSVLGKILWLFSQSITIFKFPVMCTNVFMSEPRRKEITVPPLPLDILYIKSTYSGTVILFIFAAVSMLFAVVANTIISDVFLSFFTLLSFSNRKPQPCKICLSVQEKGCFRLTKLRLSVGKIKTADLFLNNLSIS